MIDSLNTLKAIHTKFPNLTLDELLSIIDCIVEVPTPYQQDILLWKSPHVWYSATDCSLKNI